jgi:hypothetical protein
MKRAGDRVKLRALFWDGPPPRPGDMLKTATGRLYLIDSTTFEARRSSSSSFGITAVVMPNDGIGDAAVFPTGTRIFRWTWKTRYRHKGKPGAVGPPRLFGRRVRAPARRRA